MAYRPSRRAVIAGAGASALALSGGTFTHAPAVARGVVFEDRHGDGRRRPGDPGIDALGASRVIANVFDGGPKTRVELEIDGHGGPVAMRAATLPDPLMLELFNGEAPRKAWVQAVPCSHIWQGALPLGLAPGAHALVVRAWDEYGRPHVARAVIEVTP